MTTPNDAARPACYITLELLADMSNQQRGTATVIAADRTRRGDNWSALYTAAGYDALRAELSLRTDSLIVHDGQALACSKPVMDAYDALRGDRDCWERQADDRLKDWAAMRAEVGVWRARAEAAEAKVARCVATKAAFDKGLQMSDEAGHEVANLWTTKAVRLCAELLGAALNEGGE